MPVPDPDFWTALLRRTLAEYDEALLREVTARLARPRSRWAADELVARCATAAGSPTILERRLRELEPAGRQVLALIGRSRQPCWALANLVELLMALGHADGLHPVLDLLGRGLLYPTSSAALAGGPAPRLTSFEQWLAGAGPDGLLLFAPPTVTALALGEELDLPEPPGLPAAVGGLTWHEADGLEWLLRLGVLWQHVRAAPLRRTQQGSFFKRDLDRLAGDPLLNGPPADLPAPVPDMGFLVAGLAEQVGALADDDGELRAAALPAAWDAGLPDALATLFAALPRLRSWTPLDGHRPEAPPGNPFASAGLLALLAVGAADEPGVEPRAVEGWVEARHPYWSGESVRPSRRRPWAEAFLLGVCYHLRVVQAARDGKDTWRVRLSPTGRWLLGFDPAPPVYPAFEQTLLVQPNLEVVAYRQGLTPALIGSLTRFAAWKSLGAACLLQLGPETVYRALESGETFETIRGALERHSSRPVPPAVLDLLRTWSEKRERLTVYPSATLMEFDSPADLEAALARGLPAVRIAETLAVVADESAIDYRHFRLAATRDYALPPEKCVTVGDDGVTLTVDAARSDLLLETELPRFAEPLPGPPSAGRRYRLTPASLAAAREAGWSLPALELWFHQRAGVPLPPAARLLFTGPQAPAVRVRHQVVLHVGAAEVADGLVQWPETRALIDARLGPTTLAVAETNLAALEERLRLLGVALADGERSA